MWIHLPIEKPDLSNMNTIDFSTHIMVGPGVYNSEVFPWNQHFIPKVQICLAISFNFWPPILETFSGGRQQWGWFMSNPVSCPFIIQWLFCSYLLNCQIPPINPALALHSCSMVELFSTESQPAVGMQGCFGQPDHFFLLLFALGFLQRSECRAVPQLTFTLQSASCALVYFLQTCK